MVLPGDQIHRHAAPRVKVGGIGSTVGVHRHQDPLPVRGPLEDDLLVGEDHVAVGAIAQRPAVLVGVGQTGDKRRQIAALRRLQGRAEGVVALGLLSLHAPLAAVVHRRDAGHTEENAVGRAEVVPVGKDAGNALHVVVV